MRLVNACAALLIIGSTVAAAPERDKSSRWFRVQQMPTGGSMAQPGRAAGTGGIDHGWIEIQGWDWEVENPAGRGAFKGEVTTIEPGHDATHAAPPPRGSVRVKLKSPWAGCRVGKRFPSVELDGGGGRTHQLQGVTVASCGSAISPDEISFTYQAIKVQY